MANTQTTLTALARAKAGKGAARATRRTGQVPGVIYGDNKEAVLVSILEKDLVKYTGKKNFYTSLCSLDVAGQKHLVLPRDVQFDAVNDRPIHADFLRVTEKTSIRVGIPVRAINHKDSAGITKGGVLNIVRHEIEVLCPATKIPEEFIVDLAGLDVGHSIHVSKITMPAGVKPTTQGDFTVVTLVAPSAMRSEVEDAAAAAAAPAVAAVAAPAAGAAAPAAGAAAAAPAKDAGKKK
jgi:large subunit ribosomal protein L25